MPRYNFINALFLLKMQPMTRRLFTIILALLLTTCDDGDIITVNLDFDKQLSLCSNNIDSFLIYDLREDPNESLSLIIPRNDLEEFPFTEPTPTGNPTEFIINASTNRFIYRTYNRAVATNELCEPIQPGNLTTIEDYEATTGSAFATVIIDDDDGDGISSENEGRGEADENGNYPNAQNSDGDEFPDYLDEDDDNDNVKTKDELDEENIDGDNNPFTNPLDTDGDGIPNYLDTDDDGDGINTIEEDANGDKNPRNDTNTDTEGNIIAHYLNILETTNYGSPGLVGGNEYTRTVSINFLVTEFNLEILSATELDLGTLTYTIPIIQTNDD